VYTYLFRFVRRFGKVDCAERALGGTVIGSKQIRLVSSGENEIYVTSHVTDTLEIGFLDEKKSSAENCSECAQFYEERSAGAHVSVPENF
jgi:hypothetical protein